MWIIPLCTVINSDSQRKYWSLQLFCGTLLLTEGTPVRHSLCFPYFCFPGFCTWELWQIRDRGKVALYFCYALLASLLPSSSCLCNPSLQLVPGWHFFRACFCLFFFSPFFSSFFNLSVRQRDWFRSGCISSAAWITLSLIRRTKDPWRSPTDFTFRVSHLPLVELSHPSSHSQALSLSRCLVACAHELMAQMVHSKCELTFAWILLFYQDQCEASRRQRLQQAEESKKRFQQHHSIQIVSTE